MKLYATITSERATKGQGGEWLDIKITDKDRKNLLDFGIKIENGKPKITIYQVYIPLEKDLADPYLAKPIEIPECPQTKGERQKGDN